MGAGEVYLNIHNAGHFDTPLVNAVQNALRIHVVACGGAGEIAANVEGMVFSFSPIAWGTDVDPVLFFVSVVLHIELTRLGSSAIAAQGSIEDFAALCDLLSVDCTEQKEHH